MVFSYTIEALLHPWSGRVERVAGLSTPTRGNAEQNYYGIITRASTGDGAAKALSSEFMYKPEAISSLDQALPAETPFPSQTNANDPIPSIGAIKEAGRVDIINANRLPQPKASSQSLASTRRSESTVILPNEGIAIEDGQQSGELCLRSSSEADTKVKDHIILPPATSKLSASPRFQNAFFRVDRSEIAGWGAFATKDLHRGEIILREVPLFVAEASTLFQEFEKLHDSARNIALSLHGHDLLKKGTPRVKAVWDTNSFAIDQNKAGLFPIAARFNHACHPAHNIAYEFDREHMCLNMTVRVEKIAAGEELKISYGPGRTPAILYLWYGFRCHCGACAGLKDEEVALLTERW